jgi:hypothetical protein
MPKRMGRPTKPPTPGERVPLSLRVTAEIRDRLEKAAVEKGRSLSQEAELRIERSFDREELLPEVLTLAYGKPVADVLIDRRTLLAKIDAGRLKRITDPDLVDRWKEILGEFADSTIVGPPSQKEIVGPPSQKSPRRISAKEHRAKR